MDKHKLKQDTRAFQLLAKLLHMDPKKRLSAQGALEDPYFTEVGCIDSSGISYFNIHIKLNPPFFLSRSFLFI